MIAEVGADVLLIEDGSMSMWIFLEPGENASSGR
jgi:hypothetical protein